MKKLISLISAALLLTVFTVGCDDKKVKYANADAEKNSAIVAEIPEETLSERDKTSEPRYGDCLFDEAGVLSDSDFDAINERAVWFSDTYKINTAVVITNDIGDNAAADYAGEYYSKLYGTSNGILVLINNDTGKDCILRKGSPSLFVIYEEDIELLLADISPFLAVGDYVEAMNKTFELFEKNIPEFVTDRTNSLSKEEMFAANELLASASGDDKSLSIIYTGAEIDGYADEQSEKYLAGNDDAAILFVNPQTGESSLRASGKFSSLEQAGELFENAVADYFSQDVCDAVGLAEIYINFAGK